MRTRNRSWRKWLLPLVLLLALPLPALAQQGGTLWEVETGGRVDAVALSADGGRVVIGARDNILRLFDRQGELLWQFEAENSILGADISADGQWVAVAAEDRYVYLLDQDGQVLWQHRAQRPMNNAAVADDGSLVAATSADRSFYILDGAGNLVLDEPLGVDVEAVAIYGAGEKARAVIGSDDAYIRLYSREGAKLIEMRVDYDVQSLAVNPSGTRIIVGSVDGTATLLNGANGSIIWTYHVEGGPIIHSVAIAKDASAVVLGTDDGKAYLLDGEGQLLQTFDQGDTEVSGVALTADGSMVALGTTDNRAMVFDRYAAQTSYSQAATRQTAITLGAVGAAVLLVVGSVLAARYTTVGGRMWEVHGARPRALVRAIWKSRLSYFMILPTLALLLTFNYYPAISGLYHAFTDWKPGISAEWVGLENFRWLFRDRFFLAGTKNIIILVIATIVKSMTMPLLVAELIFNLRHKFSQYWFRSLFIAPLVLPGVVTILLWNNIYDPVIGLLNETLRLVGLEHWARVWYGDPTVALAAILFIGFPWVAPFALLIFYGGLISIPTELFDAGKVDGASGLRRFWSIDLPLLMGQTKLLLMLNFIGAIQAFEIVYLTTAGGPGMATYVPVLELYYAATRLDKYGVASAAGMVLFIVILVVTMLNMRLVKSSVEYEA